MKNITKKILSTVGMSAMGIGTIAGSTVAMTSCSNTIKLGDDFQTFDLPPIIPGELDANNPWITDPISAYNDLIVNNFKPWFEANLENILHVLSMTSEIFEEITDNAKMSYNYSFKDIKVVDGWIVLNNFKFSGKMSNSVEMYGEKVKVNGTIDIKIKQLKFWMSNIVVEGSTGLGMALLGVAKIYTDFTDFELSYNGKAIMGDDHQTEQKTIKYANIQECIEDGRALGFDSVSQKYYIMTGDLKFIDIYFAEYLKNIVFPTFLLYFTIWPDVSTEYVLPTSSVQFVLDDITLSNSADTTVDVDTIVWSLNNAPAEVTIDQDGLLSWQDLETGRSYKFEVVATVTLDNGEYLSENYDMDMWVVGIF